MRVLFEVSPQNISDLNDTDLRTLVAKLAEEEVKRLESSPSSVTYGGHQNAPDGGIDVRVELNNGHVAGFIPRNAVGFQVKAEDLKPAAIENEMKLGGRLRQSITDLAERNGAYIVVCSQASVSDSILISRKARMQEVVDAELGISSIYLDFYDRTRLATWVNQHAGLINWVRHQLGQSFSGWRPFENWSNANLESPYLIDDKTCIVYSNRSASTSERFSLLEGINEIRWVLQQPKGTVRIIGLSGVGKTRLLQALFDISIGHSSLNPNSVFYTDITFSPAPTPQDLILHLQQSKMGATVIVDNCGSELHRILVRQLNSNESRNIRVITVEYDVKDDVPESTAVFKLEPASIDLIERLLSETYPSISEIIIKQISAKSAGNWRIALAISQGVKSDGGDSVVALRDRDLFERIFWQSNSLDKQLYRIAQAAALIYSFDGDTLEGEQAELPILASLTGLPVTEIYKGLAELARRDVMQRRHIWRAILPHPLAHYLAKTAMEEIHSSQLNQCFIKTQNFRLRRSFTRRLGDLHDSAQAKSLAKSWFEKDGWLANPNTYEYQELIAVKDIAPIAPQYALNSVSKLIGIEQRPIGKINVAKESIEILLSLAYEQQFFSEAAKQMVIVAEQIPHEFRQQLSMGKFQNLFQCEYSSTHAVVTMRISVLRWMANNESEFRRTLILKCLGKMLTPGGATFSERSEFGSQVRDYGRSHNSRHDYFDWYYHTLMFCRELASNPSYYDDVRRLFADNLKLLAVHARMTLLLISICKFFAQGGGWAFGWHRIRQTQDALEHIGAIEEARVFSLLRANIQPTSIRERISAYILTEKVLQEEVFDSEDFRRNRIVESHQSIRERCRELAMELISDVEAFSQCLGDLLVSNKVYVRDFFFEMAKVASDKKGIWDEITDSFLRLPKQQRKYAALSAYLSSVDREDQETAEKMLQYFLQRIEVDGTELELLENLLLNERRFKMILDGVRYLLLKVNLFYAFGSVYFVQNYTGGQFRQLIEAWLNREDGLDVAIAAMRNRLHSAEMRGDIIEEYDLETGRIVLKALDFSKESDHRTSINGISTHCLTTEDQDTTAALFKIVQNAILSYNASSDDYCELLGKIASISPTLFLDSLIENTSAVDWRYRLRPFDDSNRNPIDSIPEAVLLQWASINAVERFSILAEMITAWNRIEDDSSAQIKASIEWTPLAKVILQNVPNPLGILSTLFNRFNPTSWSGSKADVLASRLPLLGQLNSLGIAGVEKWVAEQQPMFEAYIIKERESEMERHRQLHERFEY